MHEPDLIDAHTHFFSRPFFETLAALSPLPGGTDEKLDALAARTGLDIPSPDLDAHLARWIGQLDEHGVKHAVTFASLPEEVSTVGRAAAASGGRLTPFALVNPKAPGAPDGVRDLFESQGFRGIVLFPAMHHFRCSGPEAKAVLEIVDAHRGAAVVHCGILQVKLRDLLGLPRPFDPSFSNPLDVVPAANAFPNATFVIPHFGAGYFRETLMAGVQCENLCVDTSSSNAWMATQGAPLSLTDVLARALDAFGAERILFGTDSSTFPRGWRHDLYEIQRKALSDLGVEAAQQASVFGGNAERVLRLGAGVTRT